MGMVFIVVTNVKSAQEVVARIDKFLLEQRKAIEESKDFMEYVVGLAKQKLDMFNSLSEATNCYWDEIRDGRFEWQSWRDEAICLKSLTLKDVLDGYDKWLCPTSHRSVLIVQVIGNGAGDASAGRPAVPHMLSHRDYIDEHVQGFHTACKKQTWGRINSKLF
jgi:secreted Zn-dependent insulinase-like peptidase